MQWLLHGTSLTAAARDALVRHEHIAHDSAEAGLTADAALATVVQAAHQKQWDLLTTDSSLVDLLLTGEERFRRSAVYLQLEGSDVEQDDAIDRLFARYRSLAPGRLYTVTATRVKIRQLPNATRRHPHVASRDRLDRD